MAIHPTIDKPVRLKRRQSAPNRAGESTDGPQIPLAQNRTVRYA